MTQRGGDVLYVFDVNETLLDLAGLDDTLGGGQNRRVWFDCVIRGALVCVATSVYRDFADLAVKTCRCLEDAGFRMPVPDARACGETPV